jgi:hypothetical protein
VCTVCQGLLREEADNRWQPTDDDVEARILPSANKVSKQPYKTIVYGESRQSMYGE